MAVYFPLISQVEHWVGGTQGAFPPVKGVASWVPSSLVPGAAACHTFLLQQQPPAAAAAACVSPAGRGLTAPGACVTGGHVTGLPWVTGNSREGPCDLHQLHPLPIAAAFQGGCCHKDLQEAKKNCYCSLWKGQLKINTNKSNSKQIKVFIVGEWEHKLINKKNTQTLPSMRQPGYGSVG